ncbi:MAG: RNA polymerase sigma-70 factor [Arachidicoccus sp.]|nr:RNA polymerase sigma-70 factor [Arachidicoccus sp.]
MLDRERLNDLKDKIALYESETAYKALFHICFPSLVRYAFTYIKSKESAEEIASDVLFNIWKHRKKLLIIEELRIYLYISTRNTALNYLKKENKHTIFNIDTADVWLKADDVTPEQLAISTETYHKINNAIRMLPAKCRLIYKLIKEDGLKYKEAAELLGLSLKTVETQMGIAIKKLHEALS